MLRELLLVLALLQAKVCHKSIISWQQSLGQARSLRQTLLRHPSTAYQTLCQSPSDSIRIKIRVHGNWQSICQVESSYRQGGRRYWRLIVSVKYEILGLSQRQVAFEYKLFR